ncbi:MAG: hypothetical protein IH946_12580, partial [Bacteroidetes bacterium]|nr:hypothetical protein [Bacteroidota bacterium]
ILLVLLALLIVYSKIYEGQKSFIVRGTYLEWFLIPLVLLGITSAVLNNVPLVLSFLSMKNYFLFFFVFYFIVFFKRDINFGDKYLRFIFILFVLEFVLQVIQIGYRMAIGTFGPDVAMGTFPGSNNMSYAYFFPLFYVLYLAAIKRQRQYWKYVAVFSAGMVIGQGRFGIVMFPALFFLFNIRNLFRSFMNVVRIAVVVASFIGLYAAYDLATVQKHSNLGQGASLFTLQYYIKFFGESETNVWSGAARLLWFPVTYDRLNDFAFHPMIGMGPGMYASYIAFTYMTPPTKSIYNIFEQLEKGVDPYVGSQIIPIWGELGYIGISGFFLLFIGSAFHFYRLHKGFTDIHDKALALTASASSVYILVGLYINHVVESQPLLFLYVLFLGLAERRYQFGKLGREIQVSEDKDPGLRKI